MIHIDAHYCWSLLILPIVVAAAAAVSRRPFCFLLIATCFLLHSCSVGRLRLPLRHAFSLLLWAANSGQTSAFLGCQKTAVMLSSFLQIWAVCYGWIFSTGYISVLAILGHSPSTIGYSLCLFTRSYFVQGSGFSSNNPVGFSFTVEIAHLLWHAF